MPIVLTLIRHSAASDLRTTLFAYVTIMGFPAMKGLKRRFNPLMTNGFSHPYHLDESTFIFRGIRSIFSFLFHFSMKFM